MNVYIIKWILLHKEAVATRHRDKTVIAKNRWQYFTSSCPWSHNFHRCGVRHARTHSRSRCRAIYVRNHWPTATKSHPTTRHPSHRMFSNIALHMLRAAKYELCINSLEHNFTWLLKVNTKPTRASHSILRRIWKLFY